MIRSFEGHVPDIHASAWVDEMALVVGEVTIGADSSIWPMTVVRGDIQRIEIGARTNIQDGSVLHVTHDSRFMPGGLPLLVGDDVTVGHKVVLHACTIGERCLIGMGSVVMDGAVIEPDTLLGAGSLVTPDKHLEGGYLWQGSPARRVRELTDREREYLRYSAEHYVRLKNRHSDA
ncbi:gamma carbonic anhydrase family protein [Thioalkalivibrio thiocyanodenitrificans]|uniref:gamma carbonic anhydrase family protein n=1 Tax=Thioalkalivibrio thiocyanodenitrificans TaxID=243063 RepID=UPI000369BA6E|nr:gamma carbonic anhydrase family protein [Thioalkalivibrio thiocyanodenitrificans]